MERLKALFAVVVFVAVILFTGWEKTSGRASSEPMPKTALPSATLSDSSSNYTYNQLPDTILRAAETH